jgi:hypothetical protein
MKFKVHPGIYEKNPDTKTQYASSTDTVRRDINRTRRKATWRTGFIYGIITGAGVSWLAYLSLKAF